MAGEKITDIIQQQRGIKHTFLCNAHARTHGGPNILIQQMDIG